MRALFKNQVGFDLGRKTLPKAALRNFALTDRDSYPTQGDGNLPKLPQKESINALLASTSGMAAPAQVLNAPHSHNKAVSTPSWETSALSLANGYRAHLS